jgi:hypothetical protein
LPGRSPQRFDNEIVAGIEMFIKPADGKTDFFHHVGDSDGLEALLTQPFGSSADDALMVAFLF